MKKCLSIVLSVVMLISLTAGLDFSAYADELTTGSCGENVTYSFDSSTGTLTISGTGDMTDYTDYSYDNNYSPFYNNRAICSVVIQSGITSIGSEAFHNCTNLTSVEIPKSVSNIGENTFFQCSNLTSVEIPNGVTSIRDGAFCDCDSLTSIEIPNSVTDIGSYAFYHCDNLTNIKISDSVTRIGNVAFYLTGYYNNSQNWDNKVLYIGNHLIHANTSVSGLYTIKSNCKTIAVSAFYECSSLKSVEIPKSVSNIGENTFFQCSNLTSVIIPDSVTSIGDDAFDGCTNLEDVYFTGTKAQWNAISISTGNNCFTNTRVHCSDGIICNLHIWDSGVKTTAPTCTEKGVMTYTCTVEGCGATKTEDITETGHNYSDTVIAPTCTEQGYILHTCSNCGDTYKTDYTDAAGHMAAEPVEEYRVEPTCAAKGHYDSVVYCSVCGVELSRDIILVSATGEHDYSIISVTEPTPLEQGYTTHTCSVCGDSYRDNYTDFEYGAPTANGTCSNSGAPVYWYYFEEYSLLYIDGSGVMKDYSSVSAVPWYSYSDNIKNVIVTADVKGIGKHAFASLGSIETFTAKSSEYFLYSNGAIYSSDKTELKAVLPFKNTTSFTIPGEVEAISAYAFENCADLISLTVPNTVTVIGEAALSGCSSLTSLTLPFTGSRANPDNGELGFIFGTKAFDGSVSTEQNSVSYQIPETLTAITISQPYVPSHAFENCTNLTRINYSSKIYSIGEYAFYNCQGLTDVLVPEGVYEIGKYAFYGCKNVTALVLPKGIDNVDNRAFSNMTGLTQITVPDDFNYSNCPFEGTCNIKTVTITYSSGILSVKWQTGLFYNHTPWYESRNSCTTVILPDKLTEIGKYAFRECVKLKNISLPSSLKSIGEYAFYRCESLTGINLVNVKTIGDYAFYRSALNKLIIPDSVTDIGENCFEGCNGITSLDIGAGLTSIPENAFADCSGITKLVIGNNIKSISSKAFENCTGITEYTAPVHLTYKNGAFNGVTNIKTVNLSVGDGVMPDFTEAVETPWHQSANTCKTVNIANGANNIGDYAFTNMLYLSSVTIPESVTYIGIKAFDGCSRLSSITLLNMGVNVYEGAIPYFVSIYSYNNSKGELYANRNGNIFVSLGDYVCKTHKYSTSCEAATLTNDGMEVSICSVCGKIVNKKIYRPKTFKLSSESYAYDGKAKTPSVIIKDTQGNIISSSNYTVTYVTGRKAIGEYNVKIVFKNNYSGTKNLTFKITKANNTLKVKAKKPTVRYSKIKRNEQIIARKKAISVSKAQGKVTYKKTSGNKKITINKKTGRITVKKGLKKGTYKVKIKVKAKGNANYKAAAKTVTVIIKVK